MYIPKENLFVKITKSMLILGIIIISSCSSPDNMESSFINIMNDRNLDENILANLSNDELRILRNSIFAKHGYNFDSKELEFYFYAPGAAPYGFSFTKSDNFNYDELSEIDNRNVNIILSIENNTLNPNNVINSDTKNDSPDIFDKGFSNNEMFYILTMDFYNFYKEFGNQYNTDLKKINFEKTDDYKDRYNQLVELKNTLLSKHYVEDVTRYIKLLPYSIEDQGFFIELPYINGYWTYYNAEKLNQKAPEITNLGGFISSDTYYAYAENYEIYSQYDYYYRIFIPCSEEKGLIIENNINSIQFLLDFYISDNGHKMDYKLNDQGQPYDPTPLIMMKNAKYIIKIGNDIIVTKDINN